MEKVGDSAAMPAGHTQWDEKAAEVFWVWLSENKEDVCDFRGEPNLRSLYERLDGLTV